MKNRIALKTILRLLSLGLPMVLAYVNSLEINEAVKEALASEKKQ